MEGGGDETHSMERKWWQTGTTSTSTSTTSTATTTPSPSSFPITQRPPLRDQVPPSQRPHQHALERYGPSPRPCPPHPPPNHVHRPHPSPCRSEDTPVLSSTRAFLPLLPSSPRRSLLSFPRRKPPRPPPPSPPSTSRLEVILHHLACALSVSFGSLAHAALCSPVAHLLWDLKGFQVPHELFQCRACM